MNDHLRVGDADRGRAAAALRSHLAAGRLTADEFDDRLAAALGALTVADLRQVLIDLPGPAVPDLPENGLERGYRRLLALYPARYRRVHEDEMLAVLMTAAPDGKTRPGLREAADLIGGALRVWCQPARRLSWRRALALVAAGTVAGFLGGITVAAVRSHPHTSTTTVLLGSPYGRGPQPPTSAELRSALLIMKSPAVLVRALPDVPGTSLSTLERDVHVTPVTDRVVQISVQAPTASQAESAARAVAATESKALSPVLRATVLDPVAIMPEPSFFSTVADSSALGALGGTVLGLFLALAAIRPRRRFRIT